MAKFLYKELTSQILKSAFEVSNTLGIGFLEKVYEKALSLELHQYGLEVESQKTIKITYKGEEVGKYFADSVVNEKVIIEVKTVDSISDMHRAQLLNYLRATGYKVGLIINFAKTKVEYERIVL